MRVIAGTRKGQKLIGPRNFRIRPTADRIKKFIFDYLGDDIAEVRILDLFSGTGNFGIEALSRGASNVVFIEHNKAAVQLIFKNLRLTQFEAQSKVVQKDIFKYLIKLKKDAQKFEIIFADPPYHRDLYLKLMRSINEHNVLSNSGILVVEHPTHKEILTDDFFLLKVRKLGDTSISFFKKRESQ